MTTFIEIKNFNVLCGTSIRDAVKEGLEIAKKYECIVAFEFNEWKATIWDISTEDELINSYNNFCQKDYLKFPEIYKEDIL